VTTNVRAVRHAGYFDATGVRMALGRGFSADEDRDGAPAPVVVISPCAVAAPLSAAQEDVIGKSVYFDGPPQSIGAASSRRRGRPALGQNRVRHRRRHARGLARRPTYRDDYWLPMQALPDLQTRRSRCFRAPAARS
jgi:hypothetical protein